MSYMFEVYYRLPVDAERESELAGRISELGGHLDYREAPAEGQLGAVCLTFEFDDIVRARGAAEVLRSEGEYVEGPVAYGS